MNVKKFSSDGAMLFYRRIEQRMRWFIHYFGDGTKIWTEKGGQRIAKEAAPYVDKVVTYRQKDLGEEFVAKHAEHFKLPRLGGYAIWKPRILQLTLEQMKEGDELMYADTGCEIRSDLKPLFDLLNQGQDVVTFHIEHIERRWTKRDLLVTMDADNEAVVDSPQRLSGYILIRKTPQTVALINEWMKYASDLHLVDDSPSISRNYWDFVENRHDQSVWSVLTKKHGYKSHPDVGWPLDQAKIIAASRRVD